VATKNESVSSQSIDLWGTKLHNNLKTHLLPLKNDLFFYETLEYSVLPAGKLFRPKLATAIFADESKINDQEQILKILDDSRHPLSLINSALEIHHTYSLVHDDLPCMDDDDYRRGKLSTHKKFGQWQAVLAGDALLHHSHTLIGKINHPNHYQLRQFFNWTLGAKGLILGQVFDLGDIIKQDFPSLLRTHELKTGRLIQLSVLAGAWCALGTLSLKKIKSYMRFGSGLGICFQLLDDLSEMTENLSEHEREVNPFLRFPQESLRTLDKEISLIKNEMKNHHPHLQGVVQVYFDKMRNIIEKDLSSADGLILKQLPKDLDCSLLMANL
jgi:geranylgeranyl diphosphate synthase, type II